MSETSSRALRRAGAISALALAAALGAATPATAQLFYGWGAPARGYAAGVSAAEVADLLYGRYQMTRVIRVRPEGDVYDAVAVDRRGYRVSFTIDAYTGRVLESFVITARPTEEAVPLPPGTVPRGRRTTVAPPLDPRLEPENRLAPEAGLAPDSDLDAEPRLAPEPRVQPERARPQQLPRTARTPDAATAPANPPPAKPKPAPAKPSETAARPATPDAAPPARPIAPRPVAPAQTVLPPASTTPPATPPAAERSVPPVRQAAPASPQRLPEPLIDPKTGAANPAAGSVPVAPLDDAVRPATPTRVVPPATFD